MPLIFMNDVEVSSTMGLELVLRWCYRNSPGNDVGSVSILCGVDMLLLDRIVGLRSSNFGCKITLIAGCFQHMVFAGNKIFIFDVGH